ncbi:MAG TPA: LruC domain-containing protein, partial [Candidatus Cloacimonetes bacterium]|nr:LruC domain-containing protein [Candidatus Cloacimonadota bacterium]
PPYNPFIYVNNNRQKEIHLPDYAPTSKMAGTPYWGTADDDSDPGTDRYFKTSNNLPWAIHIAQLWDYPIELKQITWAYLKFAAWAESGGTVHTDWYDSSVPGNVNIDNIYSP